MKKLKKGTLTNIILILVLLIGLSLLLYPSFSNYWNSMHQTRAISSYAEQVASMDSNEYEQCLEEAREYNQRLRERKGSYILDEEWLADYEQQLDISLGSIMGYIEIPSIGCTLPFYHGTDEAVLQVGVGHIEWSSLPVGGESTHTVLSGHRGLPSAKLFSDLPELAEGDIFIITVLGEVLTYEVDQILIVEPDDTSALQIVEGEDYCTLVTCTPYGINTHRLLVRGHRIDNIDDGIIKVTADAVTIEPLIVAAIVAVPILLILLIILIVNDHRKKKRNSFGGDTSAKDL